MKFSELGFADLIALRDHATKQIWEEFDRERMRSKPSKTHNEKAGKWERVKKLAAKELHERVRDLMDAEK